MLLAHSLVAARVTKHLGLPHCVLVISWRAYLYSSGSLLPSDAAAAELPSAVPFVNPDSSTAGIALPAAAKLRLAHGLPSGVCSKRVGVN